MFDISDISLIAMSSVIVAVSTGIIVIVNYRRLTCCNRAQPVVPVEPQDWVTQPRVIIDTGGKAVMRD
jgi:hypothetical protein